jgi:hypothetical protein
VSSKVVVWQRLCNPRLMIRIGEGGVNQKRSEQAVQRLNLLHLPQVIEVISEAIQRTRAQWYK